MDIRTGFNSSYFCELLLSIYYVILILYFTCRRGFSLLFLNATDEATKNLKSISAKEWLLGVPREDVRVLSSTDNDSPESHDELSPLINDEYLYQVLLKSGNTLPEEALDIVRYWLGILSTSLPTRSKVHDHREILSALPTYNLCIEERIARLQPSEFETSMSYYLDLANKYLPAVLHW